MKNFLAKYRPNFYVLLYFIFIFYLCFRVVGGYHSFRQSQTNFPVLNWEKYGFSPFNPLIPFIGDNSNWLFEFPIYQWIGYILTHLLPLNLDYIMRLTASFFAFGGVYELLKVTSLTRRKRQFILVFGTSTPFFLYWGTTGLCDWLAIYLSILGVKKIMQYASNRALSSPFHFLIGTAALIASALIKLPISFFGGLIALLVWLYFNPNIKLLSKQLLFLYLPAVIAFVASIAWTNWEKQLYPESDPRHLWVPSSDNFGWYFGTKEQYSNLLVNVLSVLKSFLLTHNVAVFPIIILLLLMRSRKSKFVLATIVIVVGYVSTFINLNLIHTYYQIPLALATTFILIIFMDNPKIGEFLNSNLTTNLLARTFWIIGLLVTLIGSESRGYIQNTFTREQDFLDCPVTSEIKSPILAVNIQSGPALFYECELTGFNVFTSSKGQVEAANREFQKYQFAYYGDSKNYQELLSFIETRNGKVSSELEPHWIEVIWNAEVD